MNNELVILYDIYGVLLSDSAKQIFEEYYFNNLSLSEISELNNVSRNAIHKRLKDIENKLIDYDNKLKLKAKKQQLLSLITDKELKEKIDDIL